MRSYIRSACSNSSIACPFLLYLAATRGDLCSCPRPMRSRCLTLRALAQHADHGGCYHNVTFQRFSSRSTRQLSRCMMECVNLDTGKRHNIKQPLSLPHGRPPRPPSTPLSDPWPVVSSRLKIWMTVHAAQSSSRLSLRHGIPAEGLARRLGLVSSSSHLPLTLHTTIE